MFALLGETINRLTGIPVPGNIIGMVLLLVALLTGIVKEQHIENVANFLLRHLAMFFVPLGVGLIAIAGELQKAWLAILLISIVSTVVTMSVTSLTVSALRKVVK